MDISFDINNEKGDQLRIALSYYDSETISAFSLDPCVLCLVFYDVTLVRMHGDGHVDYHTLNMVSDTLARFLDENTDTVLCFYCDDLNDIERSNTTITPQEYRSRLFSKMFDRYVKTHHQTAFINHCIKIIIDDTPRFAHFICRKEYESAVEALSALLMDKP